MNVFFCHSVACFRQSLTYANFGAGRKTFSKPEWEISFFYAASSSSACYNIFEWMENKLPHAQGNFSQEKLWLGQFSIYNKVNVKVSLNKIKKKTGRLLPSFFFYHLKIVFNRQRKKWQSFEKIDIRKTPKRQTQFWKNKMVRNLMNNVPFHISINTFVIFNVIIIQIRWRHCYRYHCNFFSLTFRIDGKRWCECWTICIVATTDNWQQNNFRFT